MLSRVSLILDDFHVVNSWYLPGFPLLVLQPEDVEGMVAQVCTQLCLFFLIMFLKIYLLSFARAGSSLLHSGFL